MINGFNKNVFVAWAERRKWLLTLRGLMKSDRRYSWDKWCLWKNCIHLSKCFTISSYAARQFSQMPDLIFEGVQLVETVNVKITNLPRYCFHSLHVLMVLQHCCIRPREMMWRHSRTHHRCTMMPHLHKWHVIEMRWWSIVAVGQ